MWRKSFDFRLEHANGSRSFLGKKKKGLKKKRKKNQTSKRRLNKKGAKT